MSSTNTPGSPENFLVVFRQSLPYEVDLGQAYYPAQKRRILRMAKESGYRTNYHKLPIAAFCALSPNLDESGNYKALHRALRVAAGSLPPDTQLLGYPLNRQKALSLLRCQCDCYDCISTHLKGQKVRAFYHNTVNHLNDSHITIDGHMLGAWSGRRLILRREAEIRPALYPVICDHMRAAAGIAGLPATAFQATIWLTWKRIHRILWTPPQLSLPFDQD